MRENNSSNQLFEFIILFIKDSKDYRKFENTALKITDREQKLLAEIDRLNLLDDPKLTVSTLKTCTYLIVIIIHFITELILKYKLFLEILKMDTYFNYY